MTVTALAAPEEPPEDDFEAVAVRLLRQQRAAQGLPERVTDPGTLHRVAAILRAAEENPAPPGSR